MCFWFEAMLKTIKTKDEAMKLQIISEHVPVSVSIFSNVPDYDDKMYFYAMINLMNWLMNLFKLFLKSL